MRISDAQLIKKVESTRVMNEPRSRNVESPGRARSVVVARSSDFDGREDEGRRKRKGRITFEKCLPGRLYPKVFDKFFD